MAHIDLDVVFDEANETVGDTITWLVTDLTITAEVIKAVGSGGGWPEVRFSGAVDQLTTMLDRYVAGDQRHAADLTALINS